MMYHLRQHLKSTYQCDFCNSSRPEETLHFPNANEDYEPEHLPLNGANNNMNTNISDIEIHRLHDDVAAVGNFLQDVDEADKVSVETTKESEVEMKNSVLDSMSVENMLEELHKTGQISAFVNNDNDSVHCSVRSSSRLDTSITSSDGSLIKLELMNVDEGENEVEVVAQGIQCQNQMSVDFGHVKIETQGGSFQDAVVRRKKVS
jgi:hypothetical protein